MKKLIAVSILLAVLTAGVFAQFTVGLTADFYPELMKATAPLDDRADDTDPSYAGSGTFDFLTSWGKWHGNELRLALRYNDPDGKYSGYVRFRGDALIKPEFNADGTLTTSTGSGALSTFKSGGNASGGIRWSNLENQYIDDIGIKGTVGIFTAYFGNEADRGKTAGYRYHADFSPFTDGVKEDNFGIWKFTAPQTKIGVTEGNNLRRRADNAEVQYVSLTADLNPIYVQISGGVFTDIFATGGSETMSYSKGNAGIRVSGVGIADKVTFDVTYRISGGDEDTNDGSDGDKEPSGEGKWDNIFGVYANLALVNNLGITVGYTGSIQAMEDSKPTNSRVQTINPFYNGVDLRFNYTGIDKLGIAFNNNISWAAVTGNGDNSQKMVSLWSGKTFGGATLSSVGKDQQEGYVALLNALVASYKITDAFTARFEAVNRFGSYTFDNDGEKSEFGQDNLRIVASGIYTATTHVTLGAGLAFDIDHYNNKVYGGTNLQGGIFTFGIPLQLKVVY